jgi:hypothetical protein
MLSRYYYTECQYVLVRLHKKLPISLFFNGIGAICCVFLRLYAVVCELDAHVYSLTAPISP